MWMNLINPNNQNESVRAAVTWCDLNQSLASCAPWSACAGTLSSPGLRSVTVQNLVGSDQVQFPVALLKHVDPWQPAGGGDQSLLHGGWVHQLSVQDGAGGQNRSRKEEKRLVKFASAGNKFLSGIYKLPAGSLMDVVMLFLSIQYNLQFTIFTYKCRTTNIHNNIYADISLQLCNI